MIIWAIIPVKPLFDSKSRLAQVLSPEERADLTSRILESTVQVLNDVDDIDRILVVSRDSKALKIARNGGALTYSETDKQGLNSALTRATQIAATQKADCVLIIPADLPFVSAEDVQEMIKQATEGVVVGGNGDNGPQHRAMAICGDHNRDGSNALFVCPPTGFTFQYGPDSFNLHIEEASRLGMTARIVETPGIRFDVDTEEDWKTYLSLLANPVPSS
ncbi:MAG TPA: 2-phospho-L-lactate guanylyltransferase [candidate division Zixibacteria bacterium]|nr:2-phospho-L-lactate guanylyltransferase [candidate division Zixibacteria bacterium]